MRIHKVNFSPKGEVQSFYLGAYHVYEVGPNNWRMVLGCSDEDSWRIETGWDTASFDVGPYTRLPYTIENIVEGARQSLISKCDADINDAIEKIREARQHRSTLRAPVDTSELERALTSQDEKARALAEDEAKRQSLLAALSPEARRLLGV